MFGPSLVFLTWFIVAQPQNEKILKHECVPPLILIKKPSHLQYYPFLSPLCKQAFLFITSHTVYILKKKDDDDILPCCNVRESVRCGAGSLLRNGFLYRRDKANSLNKNFLCMSSTHIYLYALAQMLILNLFIFQKASLLC